MVLNKATHCKNAELETQFATFVPYADIFQSQCRTKRVNLVESNGSGRSGDEEITIMSISDSEVSKDDAYWHATVHVADNEMQFKIDTEADVSCLPETTYQQTQVQPRGIKIFQKEIIWSGSQRIIRGWNN